MVDLAVAAMANNSSHHIVGLTQETYNADDDNDEVVDFHKHNDASFLVAWQSTSARIMTAHEILAPRLKKLASLYEHKPFKLIEFAAVLDQWIQKGEAENAATQRKPVGHIISALAPNNQVQLTHNKQKKHH